MVYQSNLWDDGDELHIIGDSVQPGYASFITRAGILGRRSGASIRLYLRLVSGRDQQPHPYLATAWNLGEGVLAYTAVYDFDYALDSVDGADYSVH